MSDNATPRPKPMPPKRNLAQIEAETKLNVIVMDVPGRCRCGKLVDEEAIGCTWHEARAEKISIEDLPDLGYSLHPDLKTPGVISGGEGVLIKREVEKPKFVLKPHLTERPLKGHEGLEALKKQLEDSSPKRPQRRNNKEKK